MSPDLPPPIRPKSLPPVPPVRCERCQVHLPRSPLPEIPYRYCPHCGLHIGDYGHDGREYAVEVLSGMEAEVYRTFRRVAEQLVASM